MNRIRQSQFPWQLTTVAALLASFMTCPVKAQCALDHQLKLVSKSMGEVVTALAHSEAPKFARHYYQLTLAYNDAVNAIEAAARKAGSAEIQTRISLEVIESLAEDPAWSESAKERLKIATAGVKRLRSKLIMDVNQLEEKWKGRQEIPSTVVREVEMSLKHIDDLDRTLAQTTQMNVPIMTLDKLKEPMSLALRELELEREMLTAKGRTLCELVTQSNGNMERMLDYWCEHNRLPHDAINQLRASHRQLSSLVDQIQSVRSAQGDWVDQSVRKPNAPTSSYVDALWTRVSRMRGSSN